MTNTAKEHPILFSAPMVRALLNGSKTQTRRVVKPTPEWIGQSGVLSYRGRVGLPHALSPYGQPGDRLWVRETWMDLRGVEGALGGAMYRATFGNAPEGGKWRPSIHMPRWASRITLEITSVRVERLQDISEADALEEGITYNDLPNNGLAPRRARTWYCSLWEQINGPGSWDANPWVWVIEFKRVGAT